MRRTATDRTGLLRLAPILVVALVCILIPLVSCSISGTEPERPAAQRPSILLLVADDLGRSFVGAYGNAGVPTPNIDRLAREGMRFDAAFTPTAICRPSRWAMYTGLYPHASGVNGFDRVPRDVSLVHEVLRSGDYFTGLLAKFGSNVQDFKPFDFFVGNPETKHGKDIDAMTRSAAEFFRQAAGRPFFLIAGFGDPHVPYPPEPYCTAERVDVPRYLPDLPAVRESLTRYYSAIERVDRGVGGVLEQLDAAGRADDTLVLFVSDHGPAFPFAKSSLYDAGVHVPMIARWPGRTPEGSAVSSLVSFVDLRPTILDAAGIDDPVQSHGRSLVPLLEGASGDERSAVLLSHTANFESTYPMRAVRTARFKYIRNFEPGRDFAARLEAQESWRAILAAGERDPELARRITRYWKRPAEELYDLDADPGELHDLASDPAFADDLRRLRGQLRDAMVATDDPLVEHASP